jgi:probable HAF family extracellular repeat protein
VFIPFEEKFMRQVSARLGRLVVLLTLLSVAAVAESPKLTFTYTTIKVPGAQSTAVFGINNAGVMVGSYVDKGGVRHGFRLSGGKLKKIDDPSGTNTYCFAINKTGAIVGYYTTSSHSAQAFLYQKGKFSDIGPAKATGSQALGINDHGDINGNFGDSSGSHGFLLKGGKYTTQDVPGASYTLGGGINNAGLMTEVWLDSSFNSDSSLYNGKTYKTINVPGEPDSDASAINNLGDIVYSWEGATDTYGGALRHGGKIYKFHVPKGDRTFGYGINDHNVIVGAYTTESGVLLGFSATY